MSKHLLIATSTGTILSILLLLATCASAETLEIPGTGACEEVVRELANAFNNDNSGHEVIVPPSIGSTGGIASVSDGRNVLARVARRPRPGEGTRELTYQAFARDAIVLATGSASGINRASSEDLVRVFSGEITNWRELGGNDAPVHVLVRDREETSFIKIREAYPAFQNMGFARSTKLLYHDYDVLEALKKFSTAIGFSTRSNLSSSDVRILSIDGVYPSVAAVLSGKYPLSVECAFLYGRMPRGLARAFLDFVGSDTGRSVVEGLGLAYVREEK